VGTYKGNTKKVMADADTIVERLKTTDVTLTALMKEYPCAYPSIMRAIYSRLSKEQYRQIAVKRQGRGGIENRFKKGLRPWNKNMKGLRLSKSSEFKKGHLPANHHKVGSVITCKYKNGKLYRRIKISGIDQGRHQWIPYAHYLWQKDNGPIPDGKMIAHANGDSMDDGRENLILVDRRGLIDLMRKNNPGQRKKAIRNLKKTCRRHRKERKAKRAFGLKLKMRKEKREAVDLKHQKIKEAGIVQFRGPMERWYDCKGCGHSMVNPRPPCPKCGYLVFELIEQPVGLVRRHVMVGQ